MKLKFQSVIFASLLLALFLGAFFLSSPKRSARVTTNQEAPAKTDSHSAQHQDSHMKGALSLKEIESYTTERAFKGYTIFGESGSAFTRVVNMSGQTLHSWSFDAARIRLLPNCNVLVVHGTKWGWSQKKWNALRPFVREYSWDGDLVWEHEVPGPAHHDVQRLPNGNTLILYRSLVPNSAKQQIEDIAKRNAKIRTDVIREVSHDGKIVWEWFAHEHLDLNSCGRLPCEPLPEGIVDGERVFDWTHTNGIALIPENRWADAGDDRFTPGNIVLTLRNWSTVLIISRLTGEVVWKYDQELSGAHEGIMIEKGLPGAGNLLLFNNGKSDKESQVREIDPSTKEIVWKYENGENFFSRAAGVAQRLPNGNTLISEDVPGRIFEVTPSGETAWFYQAPMRTARAHKYEVNSCTKLSELSLF
ncbi:MAG: aryl-sulfate sulfotransferase [Bdellovibrionales bacterium]|nr:aryl-sulfate sulfotransferase [Bdellovibrionales bacterium]